MTLFKTCVSTFKKSMVSITYRKFSCSSIFLLLKKKKFINVSNMRLYMYDAFPVMMINQHASLLLF